MLLGQRCTIIIIDAQHALLLLMSIAFRKLLLHQFWNSWY